MQKKLIECVPNFSEGCDKHVIQTIADQIRSVEGVSLLDVDPGKATNRTVMTFVGEPSFVIEAAFQAIKKAAELIDMSTHKGAHPRMGATDVCPLIPIANISMEETAEWAHKLAARVGAELELPVYMYGAAQRDTGRNDLSVIRSGEYEGFFEKIKDPYWAPDYGPSIFSAKSGATVIGARDFLIAYNVNLNSTSTRIANRIAFDVREAGRVIREGNPYTGKIKLDENGEPVRVPGKCKGVKAIGWYIEEYGIAQISANITDIKSTSIHELFDAVSESAQSRGVRVTGSELVGLIPLKCLLDAGKHYLLKQERSAGVSERELIHIAVKSLGLGELAPFDPDKKIIEYSIQSKGRNLMELSSIRLSEETASESPAPGGGTISALCGALGVSLGTMVANLSASKRGWEESWKEFSDWAEKGQELRSKLLFLADEDTRSFNAIMGAFQLPSDTEEEKRLRGEMIEKTSTYATEIPLQVMKVALDGIDLVERMVKKGNPNSVTDAAVGALCLRTAIMGAGLNVRVNAKGLKDKERGQQFRDEALTLVDQAVTRIDGIIKEMDNLM